MQPIQIWNLFVGTEIVRPWLIGSGRETQGELVLQFQVTGAGEEELQ